MHKRPNRAKAATVGERMAEGLAQSEEVGECLEWQGFMSCKGVTPVVKARDLAKSRTENYPVCRELWTAAYGPVPEGKLIYRTCCNNACVLLDHLTIGTRAMWFKHRKKHGLTAHHEATKVKMTIAARKRSTAKHTMEQAREVRALAADGLPHDEIVQRTGVSSAMVSDIRQGHAWRELNSPFSGLGSRA